MKTKAGILRLEQVAWLPLLPYLTYAPGNPVGFLGRSIHTDTMLLSTSGGGAKGQRWRI